MQKIDMAGPNLDPGFHNENKINQKLRTCSIETNPSDVILGIEREQYNVNVDKKTVNQIGTRSRRKGVLVPVIPQDGTAVSSGTECIRDSWNEELKNGKPIYEKPFIEHSPEEPCHKTITSSGFDGNLVWSDCVNETVKEILLDVPTARKEKGTTFAHSEIFDSVDETDEERFTNDNVDSELMLQGVKQDRQELPRHYQRQTKTERQVLKKPLRKVTSDPTDSCASTTAVKLKFLDLITPEEKGSGDTRHAGMAEKTRRSSAIIFGSPKLRRDSVVDQRKFIKKIDTRPIQSHLVTRRASFAAPGITRRRNSKFHEDITCRTNVVQQSKDVGPGITVTVEIPVFAVKNTGDSQYVTYLSAIQQALQQKRGGIKIIQDINSTDTPNNYDQAGSNNESTSLNSAQFQAITSKTDPVTEEICVQQNVKMPPHNIQEESTAVRRVSISDLIESMKRRQTDYTSQLHGCKHMGRFAHVETLQVLLAKQEGISCVLRAIETFGQMKELLITACASLAQMAAVSDANCVHIYKENGIPLLSRVLRKNSDDTDLVTNILNVFGSMSVVDELLENLVEHSCHSLTLTTMSRHNDSSCIASQCCSIISNIISSVDIAKAIMYIGGVHVIVSAMERFEKDRNVQENGCRALGSFASHDEIGLDVANAGSMRVTLNALTGFPKDKEVIECACWSVACLSKHEDTCKLFCDYGAIGYVLDALRSYSQSEEIQEYGCWTLSNIASFDTTVSEVATTDILDLIRVTLSNFLDNHELQQEILNIISQVTLLSENLQNLFVRSSGISSIVGVMGSFPDSPDLQTYGCRIIGNLAVNEPFRRIIESEGGSSAVIAAMLTLDRDATVQEHGCMALINITANVFENKRKVISNGGVSAVCSALREFSSNKQIVTCALKTLGNLVEIDEACYNFVEDAGIDLMSSICTTFPDSVDVLLLTANILNHLVSVNGIGDGAILRGESVVTEIAGKHSEDEEIQHSLCQFYENITLTECGYSIFRSPGKLDKLINVIRKYKYSYDIQMCGCKVIAALAMFTKDVSCDERAVDIVLHSLDYFANEPEISIVCCGALSYMAEQNDEIREVALKSRGLDLVLSAMRNHYTEDRLQVVALMALESLQKQGHGYGTATPNVMNLVLDTMKRYPDNIDIQTYACKVLFALGKQGEVSVDEGMLTPLVDILKKMSHLANIKDLAVAALQRMITDEASYTKLKRRHSGIDEEVWHNISPTVI